MGYTHYWRKKPLDPVRWAAFAEDVREILDACELLVTAEDYHPSLPPTMVDAAMVCFNGRGTMAHEPFVFEHTREGFAFCKTAFKPYDDAVTAVLIRAVHHFGDDVQVSSDGGWDDWMNGRQLVESLFGTSPEIIFHRRGDEQEEVE